MHAQKLPEKPSSADPEFRAEQEFWPEEEFRAEQGFQDHSDPKPARRRGAQPGNHNAFKHGYYSRRFRNWEAADLEAHSVEGLKDEIAMMRVFIRRVIEFADGVDSLDEAISVLRILGIASSKLAGLLKTQKLLGGDTDAMTEALSAALAELNQEWNAYKSGEGR